MAEGGADGELEVAPVAVREGGAGEGEPVGEMGAVDEAATVSVAVAQREGAADATVDAVAVGASVGDGLAAGVCVPSRDGVKGFETETLAAGEADTVPDAEASAVVVGHAVGEKEKEDVEDALKDVLCEKEEDTVGEGV